MLSKEEMQKFLDKLLEFSQLTDFLSLMASKPGHCMCSLDVPYGAVFSRDMGEWEVGIPRRGNTHNYDHKTFIFAGKFLLRHFKKGSNIQVKKENIFQGPAIINIPKGIE